MSIAIENMARGVDVSRWQQTVDWAKVKASGITFGFCKASEGPTWVDPMFETNWNGMQAVGILRGAYHFYRANRDPQAQAEHFASIVQRLEARDLPPVLDVETIDNANNATLRKGVQQWLEVVAQRLGRAPIIYTRASFWNHYMRDHDGQYPSWSGRHGMWTAHYTSRPEPLVAKGWDRWDFWQYSEEGRVDGVVTGNCDLNRFNGTYDDLLAWLNVSSAAPAPAPAPEPAPAPAPTPAPAPAQPPQALPEMLPAGSFGRWPGDMNGYGENIYEVSPDRPFQTTKDAYGKAVRYKLTSRVQDVAVSYNTSLPMAGRYMIEVFIPSGLGETRKADYHVSFHEGGEQLERRVEINQSLYSDEWAPLGEFSFDPQWPDDGRVNITDYSDEEPPRLVVFGGVRWRRVG